MIHLTFPDGARREFEAGVTGVDIAKGISPSLLKRTVAMALDGTVTDLADPISKDAKIEFIGRDDPRALELIRHDCAHVLAEAVQSLWPGTQVTIGPVIENGFYYDFYRDTPFTPEDFPAIEAEMKKSSRATLPLARKFGPVTRCATFSRKRVRRSRSSLLTRFRQARISNSTGRASGSISAVALT